VADKFLAPVPHRQGVLTIPKRLRAYCLYRRRLLGEIARVAARTVTAAIRTLTGERALAVGIVACLQTHGSRANWHPHRHLLVTDGGFRPDGTFVSCPVHNPARLTEAFRRAVLRLFVRLTLFDEDQAAGMLTWPRSGFHVHTTVWVPDDDRAFATRLARYCARNPVALERLTYDRATKADRGVPPVGDPASAALRGRPARMPVRPWHDARGRLHHAGVGDRPDPHPPAHPRRDGDPRRRATPPIDAGPRPPGHVTRPPPVRRRPDSRRRTRPQRPPPRGDVRLRPSPEDGPDAPPPRGDLRRGRPSHRRDRWVPAGIAPPTVPAVPTAFEAHERVRGHAAARQSVLAPVGDRVVYSTDPNRNSYPHGD